MTRAETAAGAGAAVRTKRDCRTCPAGVSDSISRSQRQIPAHRGGQPVGDGLGMILGAGLDHHPDQLLGTRRAQQHPTARPEGVGFGLHVGQQALVRSGPGLVDPRRR